MLFRCLYSQQNTVANACRVVSTAWRSLFYFVCTSRCLILSLLCIVSVWRWRVERVGRVGRRRTHYIVRMIVIFHTPTHTQLLTTKRFVFWSVLRFVPQRYDRMRHVPLFADGLKVSCIIIVVFCNKQNKTHDSNVPHTGTFWALFRLVFVPAHYQAQNERRSEKVGA